MTITILTLFPEIFEKVFSTSIIGRSQKKRLVKINIVDIRRFAPDKHHTVDDKPYGGGVGMVMRIDVVARAIKQSAISPSTLLRVNNQQSAIKEKVVLLDPTGKLFKQSTARRYSNLDHLILICGHYEGIDCRIHRFVDESISIGRYILTGGEIPAMVITDSIIRLIPKVLSNREAVIDESYSSQQIKEAPIYTRPVKYHGFKVPEILLSGNHEQISGWRNKHSIKRSPFSKKSVK